MKSFYTFLLIFITIKLLVGQCSTTSNSLQDYSLFVGQETVSMSTIQEISGLTFNNITEEYFVVSDDGKLARRSTTGNWTDIAVNDWSGNTCSTNQFGDIEAITYMNQVSTDTHRYAIAEERERVITFVNISNSQTSIDYPDNSYLSFDGVSFIAPACGDNNGIEGIAYDVNTDVMYFGIQRNDPIIYKFDVPSNINGQSIDPVEIVNLDNLGLNIYALSALSVFENGNILALATIAGTASLSKNFDRIMLEFDPCGTLLSQQEIESILPSASLELEGIVTTGNDISLIGELGVFYTFEAQQIIPEDQTCSTIPNDISSFSMAVGQETIQIEEISGLTYNDVTEEFLVVSDDGSLGKRSVQGVWTEIGFNDWSGNICNISRFSDTEAITYIGQVSADTHRYAIAEERERFITFVDIAENQTSLDYPDFSFLRFNGLSFTAPACGANNGIEGLAYDANANIMYFGTQDDPMVYTFEVPNNINGQAITATPLINLNNLGLGIHALLGMDLFDNGNILVLASLAGIGDDGFFDRIMLEFDPCGNLVSQAAVEPTINNSSELEGIAIINNMICLTGEFGVLYHLGQEVVATPTCADIQFNFTGNLSQNDNIVTVSNASVHNRGDKVASTYVVSAYLSSNLSIDFSDTYIGDVTTVNNHAANTPHNFAFSVDVTTLDLPTGNYYLGYIIDPMDDLSECNEMNNQAILTTGIVAITGNSDCEMTKTINGNPILSDTYQSQVSILSEGKVDSNTTVTFNAGNYISLGPGFEVDIDAEFNALIEGCN
jgi:uncharacterized protein YjiK